MIKKNITISDYHFDKENNPYSFDAEKHKSIDNVAYKIESLIKKAIGDKQVLVRGIQSEKFNSLSRDELIESFKTNKLDVFLNNSNEHTIYAVPFEKGIIKKILEGFHTYKPKCDECPQYCVDIWMVFDFNAFENITYMHPRHNVIAQDKWKLKQDHNNSLEMVLLVN